MSRAKTFLAGFVISLCFFAFYRIYHVKFPFDIVLPWLLWFPLFGTALGPLLPKKWMSRSVAPYLVVLVMALFLLGTFLNQSVSLHVFVSRQYYPYPPPPDFYLHCAALGVSWVAATLLFAYLSFHGFHSLFPSEGRKNFALFFVSVLAGNLACYFGTLAAGAYLMLLLGVALSLVYLLENKKALVLGIAVCLLTFVISRNQRDVFLLWRAGNDYKILETKWTPYYYLNFISFNKDRCLGGVYNYLMLWLVCKDTNLIEKELKFFHSEIGKGKSSALVIGRAEGTTHLTLDYPEPHLKRGVAVEIDPVVPKRISNELSAYAQDIFKKPGFKSVSMDWRTFLKKDTHRYDVAVWDGLGIRLFVEPFTNFFQEDYLYSKESLELLFTERLEADGIFAANWGSTQESEVYPLIGNLPEGVHNIAFWTTFNDYPLMGLPVLLVAASRDKKRLDEIAARLREIKPFRQINTNVDLTAYKFNDDKPFLQKFIQPALIMLTLPFLLVPFGIAAGIMLKQRKQKSFIPSSSPYVLGIILGLTFTLFMSRCSRFASDAGAAPGFEILFTLFLSGAIGSAFLRLPKNLLLSALCLAAAIIPSGFVQMRELVFPLAFFMGASSTLMLRCLPRGNDVAVSACLCLGFLTGNLIFQGSGWALGYRLNAVLAVCITGCLYLSCRYAAKTRQKHAQALSPAQALLPHS